MFSKLLDRAQAVREKIEILNGAESIGLLEFLSKELDYDVEFITACEVWLKASGK